MARYHRYLLARGNVFLPSTTALAKLSERLKKEGWIAGRATAARTVDVDSGAEATEQAPETLDRAWLDDPDREEIRLAWTAEGTAAKYPLSRRPEGAARWTLELHRAPEYVYPTRKTIGKLPTTCKCGEDLSFEWDAEEVTPAFAASTGIFAECEACSRTFDPSKGTATIANAFDGAKEEIAGGAAYRFALVIETEAYPRDASLAFAPELVALVENEFGRSFYEVGAEH
ncbi:MAG TPA: hypothetical protein VIF62_24490 [Labilithrix sp.]|jgi:hypothetical protein